MRRGRLLAALLLIGGALAAQQPRPAPDSSRAPRPAASALDTILGKDSLPMDSASVRRRRLKADSIKAPIAPAERPPLGDGRYHWDADAIREAGAVTLVDLLQHIPGVTQFRTRWVPGSQFLAYNGDVARVRLILDGVELDGIDPREPGVHDLVAVPLWQLEDVAVERAPGELRVYMRTWRVDHVDPFTRTDITSGSENTNLYRGYYGKRLHSGGVIQLAGQQYSTNSQRTGGDGSSAQVFARLGWANRRWTIDAVMQRASLDRTATDRYLWDPSRLKTDYAAAWKGSMSTGYARIAWGNPDLASAPWIQIIAASQSIGENHKESAVTSVGATAAKDTVDSTAARTQYVVTAGMTKWGVKLTAGARLRFVNHTTWDTTVTTAGSKVDSAIVPVGSSVADVSPSLRLAYERGWLSLSAYAEGRGSDSTTRTDVAIRAAPWRWLWVQATAGRYAPKYDVQFGPAFTAARLEVGTSLWGHQLAVGTVSRGLTVVQAPRALDTALVRAATGEERAITLDLGGPLYRAVRYEVQAIRWGSSGAYRPQMDVLSRLFISTSWLSKFPRGNFHFLAEVSQQHRTPVFFPDRAGGVGNQTMPLDLLNGRLEIRIASGTAFFQATNATGKILDWAPGYLMPRQQQFYGLRWDFRN